MLCNRVNFIPVFRVPSFSFIYGLFIQQARYTMSSQTSRIIKIFYSYASNESKDKRAFDQLMRLLDLLRLKMSKESIDIKIYDSDISAGSNRQKSIAAYVSNADIIILLISASFLTSSYFHEVEVKHLLERCEAGTVRILSVLLHAIPVDLIMGIPLIEKSDVLPTNCKPISDWTNKNSAFSDVIKGIWKVVDELLISPFTNTRPPSGSPEFPIAMFSYKENPFFTGREEILNALHSYFTFHQSSQTRIQVLNGLDGMGKTQIAVKYVFLHKDEYQAIFWIRAGGRSVFRADITSVADLLFLPESERRNERSLFAAVRRWLQNNHSWLMIFDNIEDFALVDHIIPAHCDGHVLLTTHVFATGSFTHTITVEPMTTDEGALFLLRRAKYITEEKPQDKVLPTEYAQAAAIAQEFGGFALALDQAGAYIEETQTSLLAYLALYRRSRAKFLQKQSYFFDKNRESVTSTLSLAFKKVAGIYAPAMELLRLLAFLHADAIPDEMLMQDIADPNTMLKMLITDPVVLNDAIGALLRLSLISRHADRGTLSIHRIVQVVVKDKLTSEQQRQWAIWVVQLVNAAFPSSDFANWPMCERYLPHAQVCAEYITRWQLVSDEAAQLLYNLGDYCCERALYSDAEVYLTQALTIREQDAGPEQLETARCLNVLALLYQEEGNYERAEPLQLRSVTIHERLLGSDNPETAIILNNLALLYQKQGKFSLVEPLYHRILAIYEQSYESDDPEIATTLNNLALFYRKQGKYAQAELLYQRALAIRENTLEPEDPDIAQALGNLAALYQYQKRYEQVEPLLLHALEIYELTLGANHPTTAISLNNLAFFYFMQEKYSQAEDLYKRSISIYERTLSLEHPNLAPIFKNLAILYKRQGKYQEAETSYLRTFLIYERTFGPRYPDLLAILSTLVELYVKQKKDQKVESLSLLANTLEEASALDHTNIALIWEEYTTLLEQTRRFEEAKALRHVIQSINDKNTQEPPDTFI